MQYTDDRLSKTNLTQCYTVYAPKGIFWLFFATFKISYKLIVSSLAHFFVQTAHVLVRRRYLHKRGDYYIALQHYIDIDLLDSTWNNDLFGKISISYQGAY